MSALSIYNPALDLAADPCDEQDRARDEINHWRNSASGCGYFILGGLAGTGKTTLISELAYKWGPGTAVAALAGKAASVLRAKGVRQAQTIHSLLYVPTQDRAGRVRFHLKANLLVDGVPVTTIIFDEASMIDLRLFQDSQSFDIPILFVGDHGQLEPVGEDIGLLKNPHVRLETIHRQSADNPILRFAHALREGREAEVRAASRRGWTDGTNRLVLSHRDGIERFIYTGAQLICGFNRTRT